MEMDPEGGLAMQFGPPPNLIPIREAVGTGYPAFCLCRTSPSDDLRTHTHPFGVQAHIVLAPSFTRCIGSIRPGSTVPITRGARLTGATN